MILKRLKDEVRNNINNDAGGSEAKLAGKDVEQAVWERRRRSVRRLILGWDQLKKPDKPRLLVEPIASDAVMVALSLREGSSIITKIKGETAI